MNDVKTESARNPRSPDKPARRRAEQARKKRPRRSSAASRPSDSPLSRVALLVLDLFLYIGIAIYENTQAFGNGSPKSITLTIGDKLVRGEDGAYALHESEAAWMDREQCWAMLLSEDGEVL